MVEKTSSIDVGELNSLSIYGIKKFLIYFATYYNNLKYLIKIQFQ